MAAVNAEDIEKLKASLRSNDQSVRLNAALELAAVGDTASIPVLIECLDHDSGVVRKRHVAGGLAGLGEHAVPALTEALRSRSPRVRVAAALSLNAIDEHGVDNLSAVVLDGLENGDAGTKFDALDFLSGLGSGGSLTVSSKLCELLSSSYDLFDPEQWWNDWRVEVATVLATLAETRGEIGQALVDALQARDESVRWGAAKALASIEASVRNALPALSSAALDESEVEGVRVEAAYALAAIGDQNDAIPVFLNMLRDSDWWVRLFAVRLLGRAASSPHDAQSVARVVPALVCALDDSDPNVRLSAIFALSLAGPRAADAVRALIAKLSSPESGPVAAEALATIGSSAIPALEAALHVDRTARRHAAYGLRLIGTSAALASLNAFEQVHPIDHLEPEATHFYCRVEVDLDDTKVSAFQGMYRTTLDKDEVPDVEYDLPYPKYEFLRYLVEYEGLCMHGSRRPDIGLLKPVSYSTAGEATGNLNAIYADKDYVRPIYFAVFYQGPNFGVANKIAELTDDGLITKSLGANIDRRYHVLSIGVNGLRRRGVRHPGTVYILPPDTFEDADVQWVSRVPVRPLMRLAVAPDDLPLLEDVWGYDGRDGRRVFVNPEEPYPFLQHIEAYPVRPSGRPPWVTPETGPVSPCPMMLRSSRLSTQSERSPRERV